MKFLLLFLALILPSCTPAFASNVVTDTLRLQPSALTTVCRLGDLKFDISTSSLQFCNAANTWKPFGYSTVVGNATNITATSNATLTTISTLVSIGTITTGVWNGTAIAPAYQAPATQALTTCTTARTVDWSTGNSFTLLLTNSDACTLTFSNPTSGQTINIWLSQPASTGSATVVWPSAKWFPAGAPTMTTGGSALDVCTCTYNGTSYACNCLQNGG